MGEYLLLHLAAPPQPRIRVYYTTELGFRARKPCNCRFIERLGTMRTPILFYLSLLLLMEVHSQTVPYVSFMGQTLANDSYVDLSEVGSDDFGSDSVQCITDLSTCCSGSDGVHRGDWYSPNGTQLPFSGNGEIYEQRVAERVDLRRRNNANSPTGLYRCDIPTNAVHNVTDISVRDSPVYVGLYTASGGKFIRH